LSLLPVLLFVFSAGMKLSHSPDMVKGMTGHLGWPEILATRLAILEISCVILYLIPRTAVLGAVLLTGYLGGAIATHMRVGDPFYMQALLGVMLWAGVYLRDQRLHALLPLRK